LKACLWSFFCALQIRSWACKCRSGCTMPVQQLSELQSLGVVGALASSSWHWESVVFMRPWLCYFRGKLGLIWKGISWSRCNFLFLFFSGHSECIWLCYPNFCDHEFISVSFQLRSNYLASANVKYPLTLLNPRTNKMFLFYFTF